MNCVGVGSRWLLLTFLLCLHQQQHIPFPSQSDHNTNEGLLSTWNYDFFETLNDIFSENFLHRDLGVMGSGWCVFISGSISPLSKFPCIGNWGRRQILPMGQNLTNLRNGTLSTSCMPWFYVVHILLVLRDMFNVLVRISHLDILLFFTLANDPKQFNFTHNVKKM